MPAALGSCHTGLVAGYVLEGHVPAREIQRLLKEKPNAIGLAVPGMPVGSPGMDGPATFAALRLNPRTAGIPVLFLTARVLTADMEALKALGAQGVLPKPFDVRTLPAQLQSALAGRP